MLLPSFARSSGSCSAIFSGARVGSLVSLAQSSSANVRIDLSGDKALVSQQFLDASNVGATIEEVCRETMSKCMGGSA